MPAPDGRAARRETRPECAAEIRRHDQIADHLLNKRTVVLNLENTNKETARRLIDFLSGVAYSIDGALKKIATNAYVITPSNVDVGDAQLKDKRARQERQPEPDPMASIENEDLSDF